MSRFVLLSALVLGAPACAGPVPVAVISTADIARAPDDPSEATRVLLDDAFGAWGLSWTSSATIDGALELTLTGFDASSEVHGFNVRSGACDKSIVVEPDALLLAHEIGHVFGLEDHAGVGGHVMSHPDIDWAITDDELDVVAEDAERFSRCR